MKKEKTYDEYLGAGFLDLPIEPLKALLNKLRRSGDLLLSTLFCRLLGRGMAAVLLGDSNMLGCGEGIGDRCSLEFLLVVDSNLVDDPESGERMNMRRRLSLEEGASFCVDENPLRDQYRR